MEHDDYPYILQQVYEELTGLDWDDAESNGSGCYFGKDHWVSGSGIAAALKEIADYYE